MPVLHRSNINGKFYVRTAFSGVPVTFQTKHWCHKKLAAQSRKDGDEISWRDFYDLWEAGGLWTRSARAAVERSDDPLFTWGELERKIANLSQMLVEMEAKNLSQQDALHETTAKAAYLESHCYQWSEAYQQAQSELAKLEGQLFAHKELTMQAKRQRLLILGLLTLLLLLATSTTLYFLI